MNFISAAFSFPVSLYFIAQISQPCKSDGITKIYTFSRDWLWTKFGFKTLLRIPNVCENVLSCLNYALFLFRLAITPEAKKEQRSVEHWRKEFYI
jgi:hypothetical protein